MRIAYIDRQLAVHVYDHMSNGSNDADYNMTRDLFELATKSRVSKCSKLGTEEMSILVPIHHDALAYAKQNAEKLDFTIEEIMKIHQAYDDSERKWIEQEISGSFDLVDLSPESE